MKNTVCYYIPFEHWTKDDVHFFINTCMSIDSTWEVKEDGDDVAYIKDDEAVRIVITNNCIYYAFADTRRILYKKFVDKNGKIYYDFKTENKK